MSKTAPAAAAGDGSSPSGRSARLLTAAVGHFRAGRLAEAERACRDCLALDARHFDSLRLLGVLALRSGRSEEAVEALRRAVTVNAASAECHYHLGLALVGLGRREEAGVHFARAVDLDPTLIGAHVSLGNIFKAAEDIERAAFHYRRALSLDPSYSIAHRNLANLLKEQGKLDEAIAHYRRALQSEPDSLDTLNHLAGALEQQGKADDARTTFLRALAIAPDDAESHNNLGNLHWRQGEADDAIAHYRRALEVKPAFVDAHNNLGMVLRSQGQVLEALGCFDRSLTLDPRHSGTQLNLCSTIYQWSLADQKAATVFAARLLAQRDDMPLLRRGLAGLLGLDLDQPHDADYSRVLFDQFAPVFDQTLLRLQYLDMIQSITNALEIPSGAAFDVLDAGCGTGLCGSYVRPFARSLVGVDISPGMLERARRTGLYERLVCEDAKAFMSQTAAGFDLIISSDVLTYIGEASCFIQGASRALRADGRIAVSVESLEQEQDGGTYRASPSGRYKHARAYLEAAFGEAGLVVVKAIAGVMRMEGGQPTAAWILVGEKRPGGR